MNTLQYHSETRGDRRYTGCLLDTFVNVYCMGFGGLDRMRPDRLTIQNVDDAPLLIIGNDEQDVVLDRGKRGFTGIAIKPGLFLFSTTAQFVADAGISPDDLMISVLGLG